MTSANRSSMNAQCRVKQHSTMQHSTMQHITVSMNLETHFSQMSLVFAPFSSLALNIPRPCQQPQP